MLHLAALALLQATAPSPAPAPSASVLFNDQTTLVLRITTDLKALLRDRGDERKEHDGRLRFTTSAGDTGSVNVKLRTRGVFRLKKCAFPPLRLDLPKNKVAGTPFAGQDKLKVVTHCDPWRAPYEQNLLEEYSLYGVFNALTDQSFRARLAHVTYIDSARSDSVVRYAFLIESDAELAQRLGVTMIEANNVHDIRIADDVMNLVAMFQYLIGNTDWSVWLRHNIAIAQRPDGDLIAIPYDFDFAGVISAPYASPAPALNIKSVRDRVYRGFCQPESLVTATLARLRAAKDSIYAVVRAVPDLEPREKKEMLDYFDQFYRIADDPRSVKREFMQSCRARPPE
jgi:hypothetical protein